MPALDQATLATLQSRQDAIIEAWRASLAGPPGTHRPRRPRLAARTGSPGARVLAPAAAGGGGRRRRRPAGRTLGGGAPLPRGTVARAGAQGLQRRGDGHLHLLAQAAAVRRGRAGQRRRAAANGRAAAGCLGAAGPAGPVHGQGVPEEPRGRDRAPAGGDAGAVHPGGEAVGGRAGAADDRYPGFAAHPGGHGVAAAADRGNRLGDRDHRHHPPWTPWWRSTCSRPSPRSA